MKYRDIFFDVDGTLIMSHMGIYASLDYMFDSIGMERPVEQYPLFIGPATELTLQELFSFTPEAAWDAYELFREYGDTKGVRQAKPFDGVVDMLTELKSAGKRLFIVTGRRCEVAAKFAQMHGIAKYMDGIFGLERQNGLCTKPELLRDVLAHRITSQGGVMVGDRKDDIMAGHENGLPAIFVRYGYGPDSEIDETHPEVIVDSIAELERELMK